MPSHDFLDLLDAAAARAALDTPSAAADAVASLGWLTASITEDRSVRLFEAWGSSTVIDENVGAPVIGRALFEELHRRAGLAAAWPVGNAGLVHCYGYLLSLTPTPYGLKRERWLGPDLARSYGFADNAFAPWLPGASLLARATDAASTLLAEPAVVRTSSADGRETRVAVSAPTGAAALAYAVASSPGEAPLLVSTFPVADASTILTEFDAAPRLRWNAA